MVKIAAGHQMRGRLAVVLCVAFWIVSNSGGLSGNFETLRVGISSFFDHYFFQSYFDVGPVSLHRNYFEFAGSRINFNDRLDEG